MKSNYLLVLLTLILASCVKPAPPTFPPPHKGLKLLSWAGNRVYHYGRDSVKITYNSAGYPVRILRAESGTGYPHYKLRYDRHNRLTDMIEFFYDREQTEDPFHAWHKFVHDNKNRIIQDSIYVYGSFGPHGELIPRPNATYIDDFYMYAYDSLNRIIKITRKVTGPYHDTVVTTYHYDSRGNAYQINVREQGKHSLQNPGSNTYPVYDDKFNPHRLHPVWQFISKDYSTNNPFIAASYNIYGLPTSMPVPNADFFYYFGIVGFETIENIKYGY
ncbi:hypothetical protein [Chitinophaga nivalis]|uniref:YD repeat-containing protein n=1 Tax=Chitinophaga nivalis TaxID=2991709 RepID=A0ABT3IF32_9BACT|nr:hypothetical protein [Chitinophaga nivalis]MCW3467739.1 hypothetical protein [Chitinophaga nivalis]MCW3482569.1 hypothetical protein [Chitinophaga nivalis]